MKRRLLQAEGVNSAVVGSDIHHPIRHGGRGPHFAASGVAPFQLQAPNIVDVQHVLIRVPALHIAPVELSPVALALGRWLLTPSHGREARAENRGPDTNLFHR